MDEPKIKVGICDGYPEIRGRLNGVYRTNGSSLTGDFTARPREGAIGLYDAFGREVLRAAEIHLFAEARGTFTLHEVTIGVRFHWERREEQTFSGDLVFLSAGNGALVAVNDISVEEYLMSVVSSEMSGEAPFAFLKAHAIASRSWLVAMLGRSGGKKGNGREDAIRGDGEIVRWYDREDHTLFDVCADDHCQRYQGTSGRVSGRAAEAVRETRGVFLIHEGTICDARYHKVCGGLTENFATCWEEIRVPYLSHVSDSARPHAPVRTEGDAERWILSCPDVFCNTQDQGLLRRILPAFRQGDGRFFPLAGQLRKRGVGGDSEGKIGDRLWRPASSRSAGTGPLRADPSASDRGVEGAQRPSARNWRSVAGSRQATCTAAPSSSARRAILPGYRPASPSSGRAGDTESGSARSGPRSWPRRATQPRRSSGITSAGRRW